MQGSRHLHSPRPVVVVETLLVSELSDIFLRHLRRIVSNDVVSRSTSTLSHPLSRQVEVKQLVHRQIVQHARPGLRIHGPGLELVRTVVSFREVENPRIDLCIYYRVNDLRIVTGLACLLADLLDDIVQGTQFTLDLSLNLLNTESLPVNHDQFWSLFVDSHVVLGPVN